MNTASLAPSPLAPYPSAMAQHLSIGNRIAPKRFLWFLALLVLGVAVGATFTPWWLGVMLGFDFAAFIFLASCVSFFSHSENQMRETAQQNDANRGTLLVLAGALTGVVLVAVGSQMALDTKTTVLDVAITITTLLMAWVFANTVYALHYAHLFYTADDGGQALAGIEFPGDSTSPEFGDFVYFAFCIGCTLAVSDTNVTSSHIRKVVTGQSVAGFIYNVGVFALTVNLLAGKS
jgi:uncharacterized membrane protein